MFGLIPWTSPAGTAVLARRVASSSGGTEATDAAGAERSDTMKGLTMHGGTQRQRKLKSEGSVLDLCPVVR